MERNVKRAGFNWGIGRELYDFPFICIQLSKDEFATKQVGNRTIGQATYNFRIKNLKWEIQRDDNNKIISLIAKQGNAKRFEFNDSIKVAQAKDAATKAAVKTENQPTKQPEKPNEEPKQDTAVTAAITKIELCKTEATLTKYWTKDFSELQGIKDFRLAVAVRYAQLAVDAKALTEIWTKEFRDMQKVPEFKNAVAKRNSELNPK